MDAGSAQAPLARSVARQLREELTLVVGYADLLPLPQFSPAERAAIVAAIRAAIARMAEAVDRLEGPGAPLGPSQ